MTKSYSFSFCESNYEDEDDCLPYPVSSDIDARHTFSSGNTWDIILWQFCKFLESTGYCGVTDKIRIVDEYGVMKQNNLFVCIGEKENEWSFDEDEKLSVEEYVEALDKHDGDAS